YFMLGMSLINQGYDKLALPYFMRAAELDPDDENIMFQYALTLAKNNQIDDAEKIFQTVVKKNPNHSDAHYNLGVIASFYSHYDEALHHFEEALRIQPDHMLAADGKRKIKAYTKKDKARDRVVICMQSDRSAHQADRQKYIKGEHVHTIFHNEQEQFSIAKIKIHETNEHYKYKEIVAKGYFPHLQDGTVYYFYGDLKKHPKYGWQYHIHAYETFVPD